MAKAFDKYDWQSQYLTPESEKTVRTESASAFKKNVPSPDGAASQGALGAPAKVGESSGNKDMVAMYDEASPEDRAAVTKEMTESFAPHGKSLEGAFEEVLMPGGKPNLPAMARAADFGIDLKAFAQKTSGADAQTAKKNVGVAFGQVPAEGQPGADEALKPEGAALSSMTSNEKQYKRGQAAAADQRKQERRDAIAAFLMETGLRVLSSDKPGVASAFGESAMGTIESGRARKMQTRETERTERREDQAYDIAASKEAREAEEFEAEKAEGRLGRGERNAYEVQRDDWMSANLPQGASAAVKSKELQDFMKWYAREVRFTPAQREKAIKDVITMMDDSFDDEWDKKSPKEKRAWAKQEITSYQTEGGDANAVDWSEYGS